MPVALELEIEEECGLIDGETGGPVLSVTHGGMFRRYIDELDSANRALAKGTIKRTSFGPDYVAMNRTRR